jgi:hypothetical protein
MSCDRLTLAFPVPRSSMHEFCVFSAASSCSVVAIATGATRQVVESGEVRASLLSVPKVQGPKR